MNDFRQALGQFRDTIHREGDQSPVPGLQTLLSRDRRTRSLRFRLAAAVAGIALMLAAIPAYQNAQRQRELDQEKAQEQADALLMEQINANLSRSAPRALAPLATMRLVNLGAEK